MFFVVSSLLSNNLYPIQNHLKESKTGVDLYPCTVTTLGRIMQVSKAWRDIIADDKIWQGMGDRLGVIFSEYKHDLSVRHKPCKKEQVIDFCHEVASTAYDARYTSPEFQDQIDWLLSSYDTDHFQQLNRINEAKGCLIFWRILGFQKKLEDILSSAEELDASADLSQVEDLEFERCRLYRLPNIFQRLSNLTSLDVETNRLSQLPDSIGHLPELVYLNLKRNRLAFLPDSMQNLTKLLTLDLSANRLNVLPEWIGNLKPLGTLRVNYNHLNALPDTIGNLTKLDELMLDGNLLSEVPSVIERLTKLSILSLEDNPLKKIPDFLSKMPNLTALEID